MLLLEDGQSPYVLAAARAFGRGGADVGHGGPRTDSRVAASRWVRRSHDVPLPEQDVDAFVAGVNAAVAEAGYDVVFPGDDADLLALSAERHRLDVLVPYPEHAAVLAAVDKLSLTTAAWAAGLAVPETVEATDGALAAMDSPRVVKPALHWSPGRGAVSRHLPVTLCRTREEAHRLVARVRGSGGRALLQEPVTGELMALTGVLDREGRLLGAVQQRAAIRTLRDNSARAETVPVEPGLRAGVERLLGGLGWWGLANLQFLRAPGGPPRLIDFNGRFYGSLALAAAAGVDLPAAWLDVALDRPAAPPRTARVGARFQALEEDLRRARRERRGGLLRDVGRTLAYAPGATHVSWCPADPQPGLATAARIGRALAGLA